MIEKNIKKGLVFAIIILFICMSIIPTTAVNNVMKSSIPFSDGNTLFVGGTGPENYTRIQDAIDNATDGDTVFVFDDSSPYYENIIIDVRINLIGDNRNSTIIDGNKTEDVIFVSDITNGGIIKGFTIRNSGYNEWEDAGIELWCYFDGIIDNTIIDNNCGIKARSSGEYISCREISSNIVTNNEIGISIGKNLGYVTTTDVYKNYIANNIIGIHVFLDYYIEDYDGIRNNLYKNIITNNQYGILIENDIYQNIFENNISNNKYGIYLSGYHGWCFKNNIYKNDIERNEEGIVLEDICGAGSYDNNIYLNNLKNNNRGILISNWATGFFPTNNNIYKNNFLNNNASVSIQLENKKIFGYNNWSGNYWDRGRILPKIISGYFYIFPLFNIDWHPALKPYDISISG